MTIYIEGLHSQGVAECLCKTLNLNIKKDIIPINSLKSITQRDYVLLYLYHSKRCPSGVLAIMHQISKRYNSFFVKCDYGEPTTCNTIYQLIRYELPIFFASNYHRFEEFIPYDILTSQEQERINSFYNADNIPPNCTVRLI